MSLVPQYGKRGRHRTSPNLYSLFEFKTDQTTGVSHPDANKNQHITLGTGHTDRAIGESQEIHPWNQMIFPGLKRGMKAGT